MSSLEVITFGETMMLFCPDRTLPLEYVHGFYNQVAGAETNVAIGLQRLGHSAGWFSKLGNDPFGRAVHQFVRGHGVDTSRVQYTDEAPTGIFFKEQLSGEKIQVYYYRRNSAASLMQAEELDEAYLGQARILHVTGITPGLSEHCRKLTFRALESARRQGVAIVFDPNIRWKLWDKKEAGKVLSDIAALADYVLPGVDEGRFLTGKTTPEEIAGTLLERGAKAAIIKLGAEGAYYRSGETSGYAAGFPVKAVIDPMGAGDGFAAGFISGILQGQTLGQAVLRGNAVGSVVVGVQGDIQGLPTREQLDSLLNGQSESTDITR